MAGTDLPAGGVGCRDRHRHRLPVVRPVRGNGCPQPARRHDRGRSPQQGRGRAGPARAPRQRRRQVRHCRGRRCRRATGERRGRRGRRAHVLAFLPHGGRNLRHRRDRHDQPQQHAPAPDRGGSAERLPADRARRPAGCGIRQLDRRALARTADRHRSRRQRLRQRAGARDAAGAAAQGNRGSAPGAVRARPAGLLGAGRALARCRDRAALCRRLWP
jgi:hypothetical protein